MRGNWNQYFMSIAEMVASRATCDRKHVGAVIVKDNTILSTGYNGSVSGLEHCDDVGHMMVDGHCVRTVHAEVNSIAQAAKNGINLSGATAYVTVLPCWNCFKTLINSGITTIFYREDYRPSTATADAVKKLGITLTHLFVEDKE